MTDPLDHPTQSVADPGTTTAVPIGTGMTVTPPTAPRYVLGDEIARGGMGEVYRATDTVLNREVAVKVLQNKYAPDSGTARRFEDEARITGQLQHPNIPAVHDLGTLPDGRPFLAMKLIKGQTLDELLKQRSSPGEDRGRFVAVFEQICQAVAYAHAHDVIHRDLKPANVMVGNFGEVQVMDWGLAKVLASASRPSGESDPDETSAGTKVVSFRDSDGSFTQAGSILGTPAFMPPEQAVGAVGKIDVRSDVFGLGAVLAVILTGQPPYSGSSAETTRVKAAQGDVAECLARLGASGADPELVALCKRCLSPKPADRLADAGEVAAAVHDLRAAADERARQAETERTRAETQAIEQRKRQRVVQWAGGIAAGILLVGTAGMAALAIRAERARANEAEQRGIAESAVEAEKLATAREAGARQQAEAAYAKTAEVLDVMVSEITSDSLATQKTISEEQKKFLTQVLKYYQEFAATKGDDPSTRARIAKAASRVGSIEFRLGRLEEALAAFQSARTGYARLATDFPDSPEYRQTLAQCHLDLGDQLIALGRLAAAEEQYKAGLGHFERLRSEFPGKPEYQSGVGASLDYLATVYRDLNKETEAETHHRKAIVIRGKLAAEFPGVPEYRRVLASSHVNLGSVLLDLGRRSAEAEEQFKTGLAIYEKLVAERPADHKSRWNLANCLHNLGILLARSGKWIEAEQRNRQSLAIREKLAAEFPTVPDYRDAVADSLSQLADTLAKIEGKRAEAEELHRRGLAVQEKLVADFTAVSGYRITLGGSYCNFGSFLNDGGKPAESLEWYERAIATLQPLYEADTRNVYVKQYLKTSYTSRAIAYERLRRFVEAVADRERVIELSTPAIRLPLRAALASLRLKAGMVQEAVGEVAELRKQPKWNAGQLYGFACVYAVASGKIVDKKAEYADAAMEMLTKAVKAGYKNHTHMKTDTDLDPLRDREDFKKLVIDLEAMAPKRREVAPPPRSPK